MSALPHSSPRGDAGPAFGLGVPTGAEGLMYPIPYADPEQAVALAVEAERLGYDSVWANDHIDTPRYVREAFDAAPRFYDPYTYLAYVAASTTRLRLATAITVMAFRHPVVLMKQAATLDQLSGGRFVLGLGIGAYRHEAAVVAGRDLHRGRHAEEYLATLAVLQHERRASYAGELIEFADVESWPKAVAGTFPVLSGGNSAGAVQRAARYADGWLPAGLLPDEIRAGIAEIETAATAAGRTLPAGFEIAPQFTVRLADTTAAARAAFETTQLRAHDVSLATSTLQGRTDDWHDRDLIGSPAEIVDRVGRYVEAGVTTFAGLLFAVDDVAETREQLAWFAEDVIAQFRAAAFPDHTTCSPRSPVAPRPGGLGATDAPGAAR